MYRARAPPFPDLLELLFIFKQIGGNKVEQRYIKIKNELIPVSEAVYREYMRPIWRERKQAEIRAEAEVSYDEMLKNGVDVEYEHDERIDNIVVDKMMLKAMSAKLHDELHKLSDNEQFLIYELYFKNKSERDMARELGISSVAVHKRKKQIIEKIKKFF